MHAGLGLLLRLVLYSDLLLWSKWVDTYSQFIESSYPGHVVSDQIQGQEAGAAYPGRHAAER